MPAIPFLAILKSPITWIVGAVVATLILLGIVYTKGERAGSSNVTTKVQTETIRTLDAARKNKERAEDAVRNTPLDAVIDDLQ
jgi:hypothetical protein